MLLFKPFPNFYQGLGCGVLFPLPIIIGLRKIKLVSWDEIRVFGNCTFAVDFSPLFEQEGWWEIMHSQGLRSCVSKQKTN
mgnify:CR=1 FL=1